MKAYKDYLIVAEVIIEMDHLPILRMVSRCSTLDLAMLRWIIYIKSLNLKIQHISGKDNTMANMRSRASFDEEDNMVSEDEEDEVDFFEVARLSANEWSTPTMHVFNENDYEREWLLIGRFLSMMVKNVALKKQEASRIRKKADKFFLRDGMIWQHSERRNGLLL